MSAEVSWLIESTISHSNPGNSKITDSLCVLDVTDTKTSRLGAVSSVTKVSRYLEYQLQEKRNSTVWNAVSNPPFEVPVQ
jgi:hypothetical protein